MTEYPVVSSYALVEKQSKVFLFLTSLVVLLDSEYTAKDGDGNANNHLTVQCEINTHHFNAAINSRLRFFRTRLKY